MNTQPIQPQSDWPLIGNRIQAEPIATVRVPGFTAPYPRLINAHLIEPNIRNAVDAIWRTGTFEPGDVQIFHLRNVYAIGGGLLLDEKLQVIDNCSEPHSDASVQEFTQLVLSRIQANHVPHFARGVVAKKIGGANFGHFLMEVLPMVALAMEHTRGWDPHYWVDLPGPPMLDVMFRAFRLIGVPLDRVVPTLGIHPVRFENLLVVRGLTRHGRYMSPTAVDRVVAATALIPGGDRRRLFVRRVPSIHGGRPFLNQDAVCERLARHGYDIVDPGGMALEEQVALFRGARQIVGASGAALTNTVFCNPGTTVINLVGARFPDTFFWFIAAHRKLDYMEIRCEQHPDDGPEGWKGGTILSEADIRYLEDLPHDGPPPEPASHGPRTDHGPQAEVVAHVTGVGDVTAALGARCGFAGSGRAIEGFEIRPLSNLSPADIEYRPVLGPNWFGPWTPGGTFCGTRGWTLPIHGLAVRLSGSAALRYTCTCAATFVDGSATADMTGGEPCVAPSGAALESILIQIIPRPVG